MIPDYFQKYDFRPKIEISPDENIGLIVVIPSYNEPHLEKSLKSLLNCKPPNCKVEVITVINYPSDALTEIINNASNCIDIVKRINNQSNNPNLRFYSILASDLPKKQAGVGLARKIGMDEAAFRFFSIN